jgi:hypothetical protein
MPIPAKPCSGSFGEETVQNLVNNRDRAQWMAHPCTVCGQEVTGRFEKGKWIPEPHWPSVHYVPRKRRVDKRGVLTA